MRPIKFRIRMEHKYNKDIEIIVASFEDFITPKSNFRQLIDGGFWNVLSKDEYTGLKDKNGKEIYEGDIMVNPHDNKPMGFIKYMPHCVFVIKRFKGTTWHDLSAHRKEGEKWKSYFEVIGNIYENKELLK